MGEKKNDLFLILEQTKVCRFTLLMLALKAEPENMEVMGTEEGFIVADVDMGIVETAERNYKVRQDLKKEDWHYVYRHTSRK